MSRSASRMTRRTTLRPDLFTRAFSWRWRRAAGQGGKVSARFRRRLESARRELDSIADGLETRAAWARLGDADGREGGTAIWQVSPDALNVAVRPPVHVNPPHRLDLGGGLSAHHDCPAGESRFLVAQRPNHAPRPLHRFELHFESYEYEGTYASFALGAPRELRRPRTGEILRLRLDLVASRPVKATVRLNVTRMNETDQLHVTDTVGQAGPTSFDFDLRFASKLAEQDNLWVDLLLDRPRMVDLTIRDLALVLLPGRETGS